MGNSPETARRDMNCVSSVCEICRFSWASGVGVLGSGVVLGVGVDAAEAVVEDAPAVGLFH